MTRRKACRFVSIIVCTLFFVSIPGSSILYAISGSTADADDERSNAAAKKMIEKYGKQEKKEAVSPYDYEAPYYYEVIEQYNKHGLYEKEVFEINLLNSKAQLSDGSDINNIIFYEDNKEIILWNENIEWIEWEFDVEKEGLYEIELEYKAIKNQTGREIERAIYIDGELPFKEAGNIVLYRYWHETSKPLINYIGDEVWPPQEEIICWRKNAVYDKMGMYL